MCENGQHSSVQECRRHGHNIGHACLQHTSDASATGVVYIRSGPIQGFVSARSLNQDLDIRERARITTATKTVLYAHIILKHYVIVDTVLE